MTHTFGSEMAALAERAWRAREHARILGTTAVGCAALGAGGGIWTGCNVEHRFRSHDIHAETNTIGTMVADGEIHLVSLVVVADRDLFTPCGACLDWVWEFGGPDCVVGFENAQGHREQHLARELMPFYPR